MVDCLSQKGTCGGLVIEAETMDFGIGIGVEVVRISEAMGERGTKDKSLKKGNVEGVCVCSLIFTPGW